jgi:hypothetical protein
MSITLNCLIAGDNISNIFSVDVMKFVTVDLLIKAIKKEQEHVGDIRLWKVNIPLNYRNDKLTLLMNEPMADIEMFEGVKLSKKNTIYNVFYNLFDEKCINIIVDPQICLNNCVENQEISPGDLVIFNFKIGIIELINKIPMIYYNNESYLSFEEFIQGVLIEITIQVSDINEDLMKGLKVCKNLVYYFDHYRFLIDFSTSSST